MSPTEYLDDLLVEVICWLIYFILFKVLEFDALIVIIVVVVVVVVRVPSSSSLMVSLDSLTSCF
jgi:hypothetical protein